MSRLRPLLLLCLLLAGSACAAPAISLPGTPAGRLAAAWLAAFNTGDPEAMRAFTTRSAAPADLVARPMEQRLGNYRRIHGDLGRLTFLEILDDDPARLTALASTANGERVAITFETRPDAPQYLASVRIEQVGGDEADLRAARTPPGPPLEAPALVDSIDALLSRPGDARPFSGVVHLVQGDHVIYSRAFGQADRGTGAANTLATKFNLGSINKLMTKVAIGQLAAAGKLHLDDRLSTHLPDYPKAVADRITLQQLIDHRSGLGDIFGPAYDAMDHARLRTLADFVPLFRDQPLQFEPGTSEAYSNAGYVLLGLVIEYVSGISYDAYMAQHLFAPAGMIASGPATIEPRVPGLATGYTRGGPGAAPGAELRDNTMTLPGHSSSAGGGYSTAEDLVQFARALRAGRLVPAAWVAWTLGGPAPAGDAIPPPGGGEIGVAGGAPGLNAALELWLDRDLTLVVLANQDPPAAERRARVIAQWVRRARLAVP